MVTSVIRVNDIMGDISAASEEQSTGINQINQAVAQMDGVTRQNAERVQASARAAAALEAQVDSLTHSIAVFRLRDGAEQGAGQGRRRSSPARVAAPAARSASTTQTLAG